MSPTSHPPPGLLLTFYPLPIVQAFLNLAHSIIFDVSTKNKTY